MDLKVCYGYYSFKTKTFFFETGSHHEALAHLELTT